MGIAFLCNNGCTDVPQCYVICTLLVLSNLKVMEMEALILFSYLSFYLFVYEFVQKSYLTLMLIT